MHQPTATTRILIGLGGVLLGSASCNTASHSQGSQPGRWYCTNTRYEGISEVELVARPDREFPTMWPMMLEMVACANQIRCDCIISYVCRLRIIPLF